MSLILKGIDLPNCSNEDCIVVIRKDKAEVWQTGFKERTIEAIQIPKDHGRLIDDRLIPYIDLNEGNNGIKVLATFRENIKKVPTILDKERE